MAWGRGALSALWALGCQHGWLLARQEQELLLLRLALALLLEPMQLRSPALLLLAQQEGPQERQQQQAVRLVQLPWGAWA